MNENAHLLYNSGMRILLISEFFPSLENPVILGGVEARCYHISQHISKSHDVVVFARRKKGENKKEKQGKLTVYRFGREITETSASLLSLFSRLSYLLDCIRTSRDIDIDIVEGSNFVTYVPASYIARRKNIPSVAFYADVLLGKWLELFGIVLGVIGEISERISVRLPWHHFITISKSVKNKLIKQHIVKDKITIIPCGTELPKHEITNSQSNNILVISRLVPYKRVAWTIRSFAQIQYDFPDFTLTIIGSGPQEDDLIKLVKELGIHDKVRFLKHISKDTLYAELEQSKLLIHPSLVEGFGIVLAEANAYGVPYVAADIPTAVELTNVLQGGVLFKKDDFDDFVNSIKKLLKNDKLWSDLQDNGVKNVYRYEWKKIAEQTEQLYQHVLTNVQK